MLSKSVANVSSAPRTQRRRELTPTSCPDSNTCVVVCVDTSHLTHREIVMRVTSLARKNISDLLVKTYLLGGSY